MKTNWLLGLAGLLVSLSGVACSDAASDASGETTEDELRVSIPAASLRLYNEPNHVRTGCDIYTQLELHGRTATLSEHVGGMCQLALLENERSYRLSVADGSCGSKIYSATKRLHGEERTIKITDFRPITCRFMPEAQLVVEETVGDEPTKTSYSEDFITPPPPPADTGVWLTMQPKQCHTNFWNGAMPMHAPASSLNGENGTVDSYLRAQGIELANVGFLSRPEPTITCAACSCPRGDALVVKTKNADDADQLRANYGFSDVERGFSIEPKSCNTNPWDAAGQAGSATDFAKWSESSGADVVFGGFVEPTSAQIGCLACGVCPRGDLAVAIAKNASSGTKLGSLGFEALAP